MRLEICECIAQKFENGMFQVNSSGPLANFNSLCIFQMVTGRVFTTHKSNAHLFVWRLSIKFIRFIIHIDRDGFVLVKRLKFLKQLNCKFIKRCKCKNPERYYIAGAYCSPKIVVSLFLSFFLSSFFFLSLIARAQHPRRVALKRNMQICGI